MLLVDGAKVTVIKGKTGRPKKEKKEAGKKLKAHQRYKKKDGTPAVGVTTVTGQLGWNKQVLINWANRLGLQGIKSSKYRDDKADIGTLAHALITDRLIGKITDTDEYSKNQITQAKNSVKSFDEWEKGRGIQVIFVERPLVSEEFGFGGMPDIYTKINYGKDGDLLELIDLKTGKGIYPEMKIQVSAYRQLLVENDCPVDRVRILNIPRDNSESFQEQVVGDVDLYWQIFLNLLEIYKLNNKIKRK